MYNMCCEKRTHALMLNTKTLKVHRAIDTNYPLF